MSLHKVIGLMSGTSLDGLDLAYCHFNDEGGQWTYEICATRSITYDPNWQTALKNGILLSKEELGGLDKTYGKWLGEMTEQFIEEESLEVDLISSHGHTIFHEPAKGVTLQIGSGQEIANATRKKVICNFREADVALGGQGAPLVPIGDELLFGNYAICLNLGGIANFSFRKNGARIAYDVGLANMPLNYLAEQLGKPFDVGGKLAKTGDVDQYLLDTLNGVSFFSQLPPKSLGIEWFNEEIKPILDGSNLTIQDKLATVVEHEAYQIGVGVSDFGTKIGEVLVTGGGAFNTYLLERIKFHLPENLKLALPSSELISFKEALVFALMGALKSVNQVNCLQSVTGATKNTSSGDVFLPN